MKNQPRFICKVEKVWCGRELIALWFQMNDLACSCTNDMFIYFHAFAACNDIWNECFINNTLIVI